MRSIYENPPNSPFEVVVFDNASTDDSVNMVEVDFGDVQLLKNDTNIGFAAGNNRAIAASTGKYVLLLNPDTEVKPGALERLIDFLEQYPEAGAVGARVLNPDGSLQRSCFPAPTLVREMLHMFHLDQDQRKGMASWDVLSPREVEVLLGACIMTRSAALDEVGPLDETYFMFSEEVDFCYRLRKAGWKLYWIPEAQIVHYGGQSTQQVALEMFLQLYRGKLLYFRKHYGRLSGVVYKSILLISSIIRLVLAPLALLESGVRREQHLTLADRYWKLVQALPQW